MIFKTFRKIYMVKYFLLISTVIFARGTEEKILYEHNILSYGVSVTPSGNQSSTFTSRTP